MRTFGFFAILLTFLLFTSVEPLEAEECIRAVSRVNKKGQVVTSLRTTTRSRGCKRNEVVAQNVASRSYGDGSAGALNVTSNTDWTSGLPTGNNLQFTNCTVASGVTLQVPSGTVIRCSGSVAINGTISVSSGLAGGTQAYNMDLILLAYAMSVPAPIGISMRAAGSGDFQAPPIHPEPASYLRGGFGGMGLRSASQAVFVPRPYLVGGGGGAAATAGASLDSGGSGGGALSIYARRSISIGGSIIAQGENGEEGCGGGGGGVVVLASQSAIGFSGGGRVVTQGGSGGASNERRGAGGAGGGGVIVYAAPTVPTVSSTNSVVTPGSPGSNAVNLSAWPRQAGGGGGASGGDGGTGGAVTAAGNANAPGAAANGHVAALRYDPTPLLF